MLAGKTPFNAYPPPQADETLAPLLHWTAAAALLIVALWILPYNAAAGSALLGTALLLLGWLFHKF